MPTDCVLQAGISHGITSDYVNSMGEAMVNEVLSLHTQEPQKGFVMSDEVEAKISRIDERQLHILDRVNGLHSSLRRDYVTRVEFWPVKTIVYGLVAIILIGVMSAVVLLVVK